jgi:hypothetical protein
MSRPPQLTQWQGLLARHFGDLPTPVVTVLALYSFGMLCAQASGLSTVSLILAERLGVLYDAVRKRLSEFYKEAPAKSGVKQGQKRQDFDVSSCFAPLLRWIVSLWSGRQLALAIDVTNLADRFHVLCISVVVRGVGIPVAWKVLWGGQKEPWNPHWQRLLKLLQQAVPADWTVLVLSDRGLESPALFEMIRQCHWHPLMRVKKGGKFCPQGWSNFYFMEQLASYGDGLLAVAGRAYAGRRLPCTLLAYWQEGCAEPWLLLTDLPPEAGNALWYGLRSWIEAGFKVIKGGCWKWQYTRMEDPGRVERLWLVLAVATVWVVALGIDKEVQEENAKEQKRLAQQLHESQEQAQARQEQQRRRQQAQQRAAQQRQERRAQRAQQARAAKKTQKKAKQGGNAQQTRAQKQLQKRQSKVQRRLHRVSRRGLAVLTAQWQKGNNLLPLHLYPEPWPPPAHTASILTEQEFLSYQKEFLSRPT